MNLLEFSELVSSQIDNIITDGDLFSKEITMFNILNGTFINTDIRNINIEKDHSFSVDFKNDNLSHLAEDKFQGQLIPGAFGSIYKIDVVIVTDKGKENKRIVGKTKTNLITMDNEYIPINTIRDIYIEK